MIRQLADKLLTRISMKTIVLKASKELAEKMAADLLKLKNKKNTDKSVFVRVETERGFNIQTLHQSPVVVLSYSSYPGNRIDYDERLITVRH